MKPYKDEKHKKKSSPHKINKRTIGNLNFSTPTKIVYASSINLRIRLWRTFNLFWLRSKQMINLCTFRTRKILIAKNGKNEKPIEWRNKRSFDAIVSSTPVLRLNGLHVRPDGIHWRSPEIELKLTKNRTTNFSMSLLEFGRYKKAAGEPLNRKYHYDDVYFSFCCSFLVNLMTTGVNCCSVKVHLK